MENSIIIPAGKHLLSGVLHSPVKALGKKSPVVVICHGFISNKVGQHRLFVKAARELCEAGFAVVRFDYSGCGDSSGEHQAITLDQQVNETISVLNFIKSIDNIDYDSITLLGHSFGGCVASISAGKDRRIKRLVLWSPVARPLDDIVDIVGDKIYQEGLFDKEVHYQGFEIGRDFFLSLSQQHLQPLEKVKSFGGEVLIVHGGNDTETPLKNVSLYEMALQQRKTGQHKVKVIAGADHTYAAPLWEQSAISLTARWLIACRQKSEYGYLALVGY